MSISLGRRSALLIIFLIYHEIHFGLLCKELSMTIFHYYLFYINSQGLVVLFIIHCMNTNYIPVITCSYSGTLYFVAFTCFYRRFYICHMEQLRGLCQDKCSRAEGTLTTKVLLPRCLQLQGNQLNEPSQPLQSFVLEAQSWTRQAYILHVQRADKKQIGDLSKVTRQVKGTFVIRPAADLNTMQCLS